MKKSIPVLILLLVVLISFSFVFQKAKGKIGADFTDNLPQVAGPQANKAPAAVATTIKKSIFVPYWVLSEESLETEDYDSVIYFGVAAGENGIDTGDQGYRRLEAFTEAVSSPNTLLTLRMIDRDTTLAVLKNPKAQEALISETTSLAKEHGFSGVVLDLELSAIPFDSLVKQITIFTKDFSDEAEKQDLTFAMTVYGDTFYRIRPFDIPALTKHVDTFLVMAYDFHKAGGNPGPNFPLKDKGTYGYDFETMLTHFLNYIPPDRLDVIYGMFGYDWEVDDSGKAIGPGEGKSLLAIQNSLIEKCAELSCKIRRDDASSETTILYTAADGKRHIVWYEDETSRKKKEELARKMGVGSVSFWAYSFF